MPGNYRHAHAKTWFVACRSSDSDSSFARHPGLREKQASPLGPRCPGSRAVACRGGGRPSHRACSLGWAGSSGSPYSLPLITAVVFSLWKPCCPGELPRLGPELCLAPGLRASCPSREVAWAWPLAWKVFLGGQEEGSPRAGRAASSRAGWQAALCREQFGQLHQAALRVLSLLSKSFLSYKKWRAGGAAGCTCGAGGLSGEPPLAAQGFSSASWTGGP